MSACCDQDQLLFGRKPICVSLRFFSPCARRDDRRTIRFEVESTRQTRRGNQPTSPIPSTETIDPVPLSRWLHRKTAQWTKNTNQMTMYTNLRERMSSWIISPRHRDSTRKMRFQCVRGMMRTTKWRVCLEAENVGRASFCVFTQ